MTAISYAALYFIIWWTVLFAVLPFSLRTQDDEGETVMGTVPSAPRGPHMRRAVIWTTIISVLVFGVLYYVTHVLGLGFEDIPLMIPHQ